MVTRDVPPYTFLGGLSARLMLILIVGHPLLSQPAVRFIHDYLSAGKLGRLHSIRQERLNLGQARPLENPL